MGAPREDCTGGIRYRACSSRSARLRHNLTRKCGSFSSGCNGEHSAELNAGRWSALFQKFGTLAAWGKEHHTQGSQNFNLVPTWDLRNATYTSAFIRFSDKEGQDHDKQPLDAFDAEEQQIMNQFNPQGRWPFLYINGQYAQIDPGIPPSHRR